MKSNNPKGQVILTVIIMLFLIVNLTIIVSSLVLTRHKTNKHNNRATFAYRLAESGINRAIECLNVTPTSTCSFTNLELLGTNNGVNTVTVATSSNTIGTITSTGNYQGISRTLKVDITTNLQNTLLTSDYNILAGANNLDIGNNQHIQGSVYVNGNIICGSTNITASTTPFTLTGTVSGSCPTTVATTTTAAFPQFDPEFWRRQASFGGSTTTTSISTTTSQFGPLEYLDNLTIENDVIATTTGTIYVHGTLTIGNNVKIQSHQSFNPRPTVIVARGNIISIGNNVELNNLLIASLASSSSASTISSFNNAIFNNVVFYAPDGIVELKNNTNNITVKIIGGGVKLGNSGAIQSNALSNFSTEYDITKWRVSDKSWREIY